MATFNIPQLAAEAHIALAKHPASPYPSLRQLENFLNLAMAIREKAEEPAPVLREKAEEPAPVLATKFDPKGWQWEEAGKVYQLEDLSRADLLQVACSCIEMLEQVDGVNATLTQMMRDWRTGDVKLSEEG